MRKLPLLARREIVYPPGGTGVVPPDGTGSSLTFERKPCRKFAEVFTNPERPVEAILARVASESRNVHYLDASKAMCVDPEGCSIRVGDEVIYRDKHHLRHDLRLDTRQEIVSRLRLGEVLEAAIRDSRKVKRQRAPKSDPGAPG